MDLQGYQIPEKYDDTDLREQIANKSDKEHTHSTLEERITALEEQLNNIQTFDIDKVYPIGSLYFSTRSVPPSRLFGGTWDEVDEGIFRVGQANHGYIEEPEYPSGIPPDPDVKYYWIYGWRRTA